MSLSGSEETYEMSLPHLPFILEQKVRVLPELKLTGLLFYIGR